MEYNQDTFKDLVKEFEDLNDGHFSYITVGECEGETLAIFESWDHLENFEAFLNGFTGLKGSKPYLRDDETLADQLAKVNDELKTNPDNFRLKDQKQILLTHLLYAQHLVTLGEDYEVIDCNKFDIQNVFNDEYDTCSCCGAILRTSPDSYSWVAPLITEDGYVCDSCVQDGQSDEYILEEYCNQPKAIPESADKDRLGIVKVNDDELQNGLYGGQMDDPRPIIEALNEHNIDVWFEVFPQQFMCSFDVYVRQDDLERAKEILSGTDTTADEDPAIALQRGLKSASEQMNKLEGEGIKYAKVNSDGSADVRLVSNDEFIKGIK